jgi:hypothetical protein
MLLAQPWRPEGCAMVKYTSKHHSPEDPGGLIYEVLQAGDDYTGPAEDIILTWMLGLDDGQDPAATARHLLEAYGCDGGALPGGSAGRLIQLLRETTEASPERPAKRSRRRRRSA